MTYMLHAARTILQVISYTLWYTTDNFRDEAFQAIHCVGTGNQNHYSKDTIHEYTENIHTTNRLGLIN